MSRQPDSHLARFLKHEAKSLKLKTTDSMAQEIGIRASRLDAILEDRVKPTPDEADHIARFLGPETWKLVNSLEQQESEAGSGPPAVARGSDRRRITQPPVRARNLAAPTPTEIQRAERDDLHETVASIEDEATFIQKHLNDLVKRVMLLKTQIVTQAPPSPAGDVPGAEAPAMQRSRPSATSRSKSQADRRLSQTKTRSATKRSSSGTKLSH